MAAARTEREQDGRTRQRVAARRGRKPLTSDPCHIPACSGSPAAPDHSAPAAIGTNCASSNPFNPNHVCNATGSCVGCNTNPDCNLSYELDAGLTTCINHECQ